MKFQDEGLIGPKTVFIFEEVAQEFVNSFKKYLENWITSFWYKYKEKNTLHSRLFPYNPHSVLTSLVLIHNTLNSRKYW